MLDRENSRTPEDSGADGNSLCKRFDTANLIHVQTCA